MLTLATVLAVLILPMTFVAALLLATGRLQRAREAWVARQVALTDAIHRELGAVVSPFVRWRLGHGWRVEVAVPFEHPAIVARVIAITHAEMLRTDGRAARFEVVLTAQEPRVRLDNAKWLRQAGHAPLAASEREAMAWTGTTTSRASW